MLHKWREMVFVEMEGILVDKLDYWIDIIRNEWHMVVEKIELQDSGYYICGMVIKQEETLFELECYVPPIKFTDTDSNEIIMKGLDNGQ